MATEVAKEKDTTGFGQRLRALREARGLSQAGLGELCSPAMTYQNIARLERSDRTPSWDTVLRLADALQVSTEEFRAKGEQ
ncbi:MAG TPA: helix-turn-helix transcriptional regulator [Gemmata sp.]